MTPIMTHFKWGVLNKNHPFYSITHRIHSSRLFTSLNGCERFSPRSTLVLKADLKVYQKAHTFAADLLFLDLQDGVPNDKKVEVRTLISHAFEQSFFYDKKVVVRINELTKPDELSKDLQSMLKHAQKIFGFVLPMVKSAEDILHYEEIIQNIGKEVRDESVQPYFFPIIETALAVKNTYLIARASSMNLGLYFGDADLSSELQAIELSYARQKYILEAIAAGVAPIDGTYTKLDDDIGLESKSIRAKEMGFVGKAAIHTKQLHIINMVFSPSKREIEWANQVQDVVSKEKGTHRFHDQSSREFFGPPHIKIAQKILNYSPSFYGNVQKGAIPKFIQGGLDKNLPDLGSLIECQFELTLSSGILALWEGLVFNSSKIHSSGLFAKKLGFSDRIVPNSLLMTLAASLAVTRFSESAKVHLSFKHAKYVKAVYPSDVLTGFFSIQSLRESQSKKGTIIQSHHFLKNQNHELVYQIEKWTLFPTLDSNWESCEAKHLESKPSDLYDKILSIPAVDLQNDPLIPHVKEGEIIVHRLGKAFEQSEIKTLCHIVRATNAHHYDSNRFQYEEILVPGPFVVHAALGCAKLDLGNILYEDIFSCDHIAKVNLLDTIYPITYIKSVESIRENMQLERLQLVTLVLKNINIDSLKDEKIPLELFDEKSSRVSKMHSICLESISNFTYHIACKIEYAVIRPRQKNSEVETIR